MQKIVKVFANVNIVIGVALMAIPFGYVFLINTPEIWYRINPGAIEDEIRTLAANPFADTLTNRFVPDNFVIQPERDDSLPQGRSVTIAKIGVDTSIREGKNGPAVLSQGVWLMPDLGTPNNNDRPVILAAHRWGPTGITSEYRNKNMFFNLPKLEVGDKIIVNWDQRQYVYQVNKTEVANNVNQLSDLILITCQYYSSEERIIVFATRIS
jgi:LPXTG-site transpeptidase (sortase) family protein